MRFGLIARSEDRGLGNLCHDFFDHMQPDKTLVVIPAAAKHNHLTSHVEWYPDATIVRFDGRLNEKVCREWLDGLDVVYTAETFYDWRFCRWAKEQGVATVCHVMPEWMRPEWAAEPSAWWAPTSWRLDHLPEGTKVVPVPVSHRGPQAEREPGPFRWLHITGAGEHDRNGTRAVLDAARALDPGQTVTIHTQFAGYESSSPRVTIDHTNADRWEMYDGFDALVMPRRYAGLCLPVLEALGSGLPVVMTNMSPQNTDWPVETVATEGGRPVQLWGRQIPTGNAVVRLLAEKMNRWMAAPSDVDVWRKRTAEYVAENCWEVRAPQIRAELERVAA